LPLVNKHKHPTGTIALWHIVETPEILQAKLTIDTFIPFSTVKRNTHWLAARISLQEAVGNASSKLVKNEDGKPFLTDEDGHISITHSGNMAAAIFNAESSCGIDLEYFDHRISRLGYKFTSDAEFAMFPPGYQTACTCLLWSAKESVFKYTPLPEVSFKEQIQLQAMDFENQTLSFLFTRIFPYQTLKIYYRVYEVMGKDVFETPLLSDMDMNTNERYILTWI